MSYSREADLVAHLTMSDSGKLFFTEVPLFKKMIDAYALTDDSTYAYEAKLKNWRKGLAQAAHYLLAADYVYLAVPVTIAHRVLEHGRDLLDESGIGLLAVDGQTTELVPPRKSDRVMVRCKEDIMAYISDRNEREEE